jgi:sporulation protein YlmC with PRC-barrel domain
MTKTSQRTVRLEDLLGRQVRDSNGASVGRIEEVRAERHGDVHQVTEYLLGPGAWIERMALTARMFGRHPHLYVARWDQIDISNPFTPKLTCAVGDLQRKRSTGARRG